MNNLKKFMIALVLIVSIIGTVGCEEKGETEKAGEKMDKADKAMEDTSKKAMEDTSKKASDL